MAPWVLSAILAGVAAEPVKWEIPEKATFKSWFDRDALPPAWNVSTSRHKTSNFLFGEAAHYAEFHYWAYRIDGDLRALDNLVDFADIALAQACPRFVASKGREGCPHHTATNWVNVSQFTSVVSAAATILDTEWPDMLDWHRTPQFYKEKASFYVGASAQFIQNVGDYNYDTYVKGGYCLPSAPWNQLSHTLQNYVRFGHALTLLKDPAYDDALKLCKEVVQGFVAHWANATIQETNPETGHDFVEWGYISKAEYKNLPELRKLHNGSGLHHGEDVGHGAADVYGLWTVLDKLGVTSSSDRQFILDQMKRASVTAYEVMQCRDSNGKPNGLFRHNMGIGTRPLFGPVPGCTIKLGDKWNLLTLMGPVADELHDSLQAFGDGGGNSYMGDLNGLLHTMLHNAGRFGDDAWYDTSPIKPIRGNMTLQLMV